MISIEVKDMTCGHCESTLRKAITAVDAGATVNIDLATHRLDITSATANAHTLIEAVRAAGYTPALASPAAANAPAQPTRGCCCG